MERYERYKDSGVKWIGEIPGHWELRKMKYTFCERSQKGFPNEPLLAATQNHGVIKKSDYENRTVEATKNLDTLKLVEKGDFVISLRSFQGGIEYSYCRGIISPAYTVLKAHHLSEPYFKHLAKSPSFIDLLKSSVTGIREGQNIDYNKLKVEFMPIPTIEEQQAIATYLDTITAKIDEAIAQQQKMIDLLNERKQIIINNAVTKGLNPDAPMKDSGVDWIGKIPEHWEVSRIKNVITLLTDYDANGSFSDIAKNCNINNGTPYAWMVRTTDLVNNRVGIVEGNNYCDKKTYDYLAKSSLESGDLLMTKRGNVGMVYVVPECSCPMTLAPNLYLLKTKASDINNRYLMHYLSSTKPKSQLAILNKSTTLGALYKDDVKSLQIVLPPIDEQLLLAQFIDKELDKVDSVISNCNRQISLLQERKQIIINDVVTGKVKVS